MKILLVEDDPGVARSLVKALRHTGYEVDPVALGADALLHLESHSPDLVVLDLGLPDMDGTLVLEKLRQVATQLPVLVLTARDATSDKVTALDLGADDYLPKPFQIEELLARLRAIARRLGHSGQILKVGSVELDGNTQQVRSGAEIVPLARKEFRLLKVLMESAGRVRTRASLEETLSSSDADLMSNALEVHVSNLRKKLPAGFIRTVRGVGYAVNIAE